MNRMTSLIALSVAGAFSFAPVMFADTKGGERLNTLNSTRIDAQGPAAVPMRCRTELRSVVDASARGAFKPATVYTVHLCPSCGTREVVQGAGKLAARKVEHVCSQAATCCAK